MTSQAADHRRATAERNVAAILDAAAELLSQQGAASIAAVAAQAGVSRVTVYAHFPTGGGAARGGRRAGRRAHHRRAGDGPVRGRTAMIELMREYY